jgi:hypothetical protein
MRFLRAAKRRFRRFFGHGEDYACFLGKDFAL